MSNQGVLDDDRHPRAGGTDASWAHHEIVKQKEMNNYRRIEKQCDELEAESLRRRKAYLDKRKTEWTKFRNALTLAAQEHRRIFDEARRRYDRTKKLAWLRYQARIRPAAKTLGCARKQARAEYEGAVKLEREAYQHARDIAWSRRTFLEGAGKETLLTNIALSRAKAESG